MAGRLRRKALSAEIGFAYVPSPFGDLLAATTGRGLVRLAFPDEEPGEVLELIEADLSVGAVESPRRLDAVRKELDEYFAGRRTRFETDVDLSLVCGFSRRVLEATARIPFGSVSTYGDVAARAGSPRGARAAGNALRGNPVPILVPCHRVVPSGGGLGGYGGHEERKAFLLELEGAR